MRTLLALCVALIVLPVNGCKPTPAYGIPREALKVWTTTSQAGTFWLHLSWTFRPITDGKGPIDSVLTNVGKNVAPVDPQSHALPATATADSFLYSSVVGVTYTGFACARTKRRALPSDAACQPWTYTEQDTPPPPPILDPVVVGLVVVPGTAQVVAETDKQFCALVVFATGQKALIGGQRLTPCEAVEAALPPAEQASTAQFAVAGEYLSCNAAGSCLNKDGQVVVRSAGTPAGVWVSPTTFRVASL
jgi:hypothetical protein